MMTRLKINLLAFVLLSFLVISCEKEVQKQTSELENLNLQNEGIQNEDFYSSIPFSKVAVLSKDNSGNMLSLLKENGVEQYEVSPFATSFQEETGFLYVNIDDMSSLDNSINSAQKAGINLIIESGNNDKIALRKFVDENFGFDGDLNALIILNNGIYSELIPIYNGEGVFNISDAFVLLFPDFEKPCNEVLSIVPENNNNDNFYAEDALKSTATEKYSTSNKSKGKALSYAKKKYGGGCSWSFQGENWKSGPSITNTIKKNTKVVALKKGDIHDARGHCQGDYKANYSNSFAVSKTWSVSVGGKAEVSGAWWKLGLSATASYGNGETKTTTNGNSLSLRRRYAQAWIGQQVTYLEAYTTGEVEYKWRVTCKGESKGENVYVNVKYNNYLLKTEQPKSKAFYKFAQWGSWLKRCK